MKLARRIHLVLGVFFAPTVLFFAATGALQTLGLQDRREDRPPPSWIAHVAEVHKHQRWEPRRRPAPPPAPSPGVPSGTPAAGAPGAAGPGPTAAATPPKAEWGRTLLRGFCVLLSAGLIVTTLLGLWMAWLVPRDRRLVAGLVAAGTLLPVIFLLL